WCAPSIEFLVVGAMIRRPSLELAAGRDERARPPLRARSAERTSHGGVACRAGRIFERGNRSPEAPRLFDTTSATATPRTNAGVAQSTERQLGATVRFVRCPGLGAAAHRGGRRHAIRMPAPGPDEIALSTALC